jgi:hypothetical protein
MEQIDRNNYRLSSGREFYANNGIVGISSELDVSEGYDGGITIEGLPNFPSGWIQTPWTCAELCDFADYMIELWEKFARKYGARVGKADEIQILLNKVNEKLRQHDLRVRAYHDLLRRFLDNHCQSSDQQGTSSLCECRLCNDTRTTLGINKKEND